MKNGTIPFTKMNSLGNEFVVINLRSNSGLHLTDAQVRAIADRSNPVTKGCDQVLLIREPKSGGYCFMEIRNADGGEVEACGNGARAVAAYLFERDELLETPSKTTIIETRGGELKAFKTQWNNTDVFGVQMPKPKFGWQDIPLSQETPETSQVNLHPDLPPAFLVNVGNPHAVFFIEDERNIDTLAQKYGAKLEHHKLFPNRANINFGRIIKSEAIHLATWERGAGLTKACGTGACATAIAAYHLQKAQNHNDEFTICPPFARMQNNDLDSHIPPISIRPSLPHNGQYILVDYNNERLSQQGFSKFEFNGELEL